MSKSLPLVSFAKNLGSCPYSIPLFSFIGYKISGGFIKNNFYIKLGFNSLFLLYSNHLAIFSAVV
jgi:hypothetical protein